MEIELKINSSLKTEKITIEAKELTPKLQEVMQYIEATMQDTMLYGKKDDAIYPLQADQVIRFYTEQKAVYAETKTDVFKIDQRIYALEARLPQHFIRISQSELINIHFIKKLKQQLSGFIEITFENDSVTQSSRRYVKKIKEALQL